MFPVQFFMNTYEKYKTYQEDKTHKDRHMQTGLTFVRRQWKKDRKEDMNLHARSDAVSPFSKTVGVIVDHMRKSK